ncbi:autotransporter outer membrane beta-barrel domain-containing protein, partial [Escherichia coli]
RVARGTQGSFTKNVSAYTEANYLRGGDEEQDWAANVGKKDTWEEAALRRKKGKGS